MDLTFEVHEDYLLAHTALSGPDRFSSPEYQEDIIALQRRAREAFPEGISYLPENALDMPLSLGFPSAQAEAIRMLENTEEYRRVLGQTQEYQREVEAQWNSQLGRTLSIMRSLTGMAFDDHFTVYVTHPSLKNGLYLGQKRIAWGHHEDFPNYSTVYLWHETLHDKLPKDERGHAVIELATNEELRVRLNGGEYPPFVGHPHLTPLKEKLLPSWKAYLASPNRNILEFYRRSGEGLPAKPL